MGARAAGGDEDDLALADGDQWPGLAQREAVMESIPSEDERVLFGMIFALEASDNHRKAVGGVEPRGGRESTEKLSN